MVVYQHLLRAVALMTWRSGRGRRVISDVTVAFYVAIRRCLLGIFEAGQCFFTLWEFHDVVGDTSRMVDMFYEYGGFLHTAGSFTWRPAECKEYRFPWRCSWPIWLLQVRRLRLAK